MGAVEASADHPMLPLQRHLPLAPGAGNPRNNEGDFIQLKDGRWLFIYTHFTASAADHARAHLASRESSDGGRTWSGNDKIVVSNEGGFNVMSVSLLWDDHCGKPLEYRRTHPPIRTPFSAAISKDGGRTWKKKKFVEDQAGHGYCYTAVAFEGGRVLLGYCAHKSTWGLETAQISSFNVRDLYR